MRIAQAKVERMLEHYRDKITKPSIISELTLDDLRSNFICYALRATEEPGLRTLVTALITYCTEWDFRKDHFEHGVGEGTSEPFFLHLFRGCILFESLLKYNPNITPNGNSLNPMLNDLRIREKLNSENVQGKGGGQSYVLEDVFAEIDNFDGSISEAIKITYITRNTLGHNIGWNNFISQSQYTDLYFIIGTSCLHVISRLW